jgi:GNAT superfamily N-acetyltransferase
MEIREALPQESEELQKLQEMSPQGKSLTVTTVNIPDFFSRVRTYESWKVFNAYEGDRIIASAACAIRDAVIGSQAYRVGYEFQYFTCPDYRRLGVARRLREKIESYLSGQGAVLSYAFLLEGNNPSIRLFELEGFYLHRKLVMPGIAVIKEMQVPDVENIRPITPGDLKTVSDLLNETWHGHDMFEPVSVHSLARQFKHIEDLDYSNVYVYENEGSISACIACWDWSKIMKLTLLRRSLKMQIVGNLLVMMRILPRFPAPGDTLRQMMLTMIGYKLPADLSPLVKYANNLALREGIEQLFCICERHSRILESMKGFTRFDIGINLYVKPLRPDILLTDAPVATTGFDM